MRQNDIKSKAEKEVNQSLNLLLTRNGSKVNIEIYRKPTNVNRFLNFKSNVWINCKIAVIDSLIRRAIILNGSEFDKKITFIMNILLNNYYPISLINSRFRIISNRVLNRNSQKLLRFRFYKDFLNQSLK